MFQEVTGTALPRTSREMSRLGARVALPDLAPGDLVFFGGDLHHVGIYEGGGVMIHAPHTGDYVKRTSIWAMGEPPVGAVRP